MFDLSHISYAGIVIMLVVTGMGLPIPEEVPVMAAGAASSYGQLNPWIAYACCVVGAILGDMVMYGIGYFLGHRFLNKHPRFAKVFHADRFDKVLAMYQKHGLKLLFIARFLVGIRGPVYLSSGLLRIPFRSFVLVDSIAATTVTGFFFGLAYLYARHVEALFKTIHDGQLTVTVLLLAAVAIGGFIWWRYRKRKSQAKVSEVVEGGEFAADSKSESPKVEANVADELESGEPVSASEKT